MIIEVEIKMNYGFLEKLESDEGIELINIILFLKCAQAARSFFGKGRKWFVSRCEDHGYLREECPDDHTKFRTFINIVHYISNQKKDRMKRDGKFGHMSGFLDSTDVPDILWDGKIATSDCQIIRPEMVKLILGAGSAA